MKVSEIYKKYKIMPRLQDHMLRVAAVASMISDNFQKPVDKNLIIPACLLHDIGNIVKSDFNKWPPEITKEKDLGYWLRVQNEFIEKYGSNDHTATINIINEIGLDQNITDILHNLEFSYTLEIADSKRFERKIIKYSDMRIAPYRVDTLKNRFSELKKRYGYKRKKRSEAEFDKLASAWKSIEKQIFAHCKIKPEDITEEKVRPLIENLRNFEIETS